MRVATTCGPAAQRHLVLPAVSSTEAIPPHAMTVVVRLAIAHGHYTQLQYYGSNSLVIDIRSGVNYSMHRLGSYSFINKRDRKCRLCKLRFRSGVTLYKKKIQAMLPYRQSAALTGERCHITHGRHTENPGYTQRALLWQQKEYKATISVLHTAPRYMRLWARHADASRLLIHSRPSLVHSLLQAKQTAKIIAHYSTSPVRFSPTASIAI